MVDTQSMAVTTIREIYLLLIFGTIGFMIVHNTIIWLRKTRWKDPGYNAPSAA